MYAAPVINGIAGAIVGSVADVRPHPRGDFIWLADVDLGNGEPPVQIVFGGERKVIVGELVPVAPPGARVFVHSPELVEPRRKKMRARTYRGERSHGMLCSLDELGWMQGGPNEVAILHNVTPGESIDDFSAPMWPHLVAEWDSAQEVLLGAMVDKAVPSAPPMAPTAVEQTPTLASTAHGQRKISA